MIQRRTQAQDRYRFRLAYLAPLLLFGGTLITGQAGAQAAAVRHTVPHAEQKASARYWSDSRVKQAVQNGSPVDRTAGDPPTTALRHSAVPPEWGNPAIGKIVYREAGIPFSCSGAVINTWSQKLVLTAGHCLLYRRWSSYVRFIPGYERGSRPYGTWAAKDIWVTNGWWRGNPNYDIGLIVIRSRVGDVTGAIDYQPYPRRAGVTRIFGYPAGEMRGERQRVCSSSTWAGDFISFRLPGPNGMVARCNMAGGSSGGPWLSSYENSTDPDTSDWILDGLTSRGGRGKLTSPYLGRQFVQLVRQAQR